MEGKTEIKIAPEISVYKPVPVYSLVSIRNLYTIYHMTYADGFVFPGERHDFWELAFVRSGECTITSEDRVYHCTRGDVILHAPKWFHSIRVEEGASCKLFTVSFDGMGLSTQVMGGHYRSTEEEEHTVGLILKELFTLFGEQDETEFTRFFSSVSVDNVGLQIIKSLIELICLSLIRRGEDARISPSKDPTASCYTKIMSFMRDNIDRNLTLNDICLGVYESPGKVKAIFHRFTGGGIMQHFNHLRVSRVISLLSSGKSVKEISQLLDFSSPYYLSYFFKRETGMTIREYKGR